MTTRFTSESLSLVWSSRAQTGLLFVGTLCVLVQVVCLLIVPPATGFETSIVRAYPALFWVCFYEALVISIVCFFIAAAERLPHWRQALVLLTVNYGLFFFLPVFRGYHLYGRGLSDVLGHLGFAKGIVQAGHLPQELFYPLQHVIMVELTYFGMQLETTRYLMGFVFTMLYIVSMGVVVRKLAGHRWALPVGLGSATPLLFTYFHLTLHPAFLSFMLFPVFLAALVTYRDTASKEHFVFTVLLAITIVFFHPMTTLYLVALVFATIVFGRLASRLHGDRSPEVARTGGSIVIMVVPIWFFWYIKFPGIQSLATSSVEGIVQGKSAGAIEAGNAGSAALTTSQLAIRFVQLYGGIFVYLGLGGLFAAFIVWSFRTKSASYAEGLATTHYLVGGSLAVVFLASYFIAVGPIRVSRYFIMGATLLVALLFVREFSSDHALRWFLSTALVCCVVFAAVFGANGAYWPNKHMTEAEYDGSSFILAHDVEALPIRAVDTSYKMPHYITGDVDSAPGKFRETVVSKLWIHLGYDRNQTAAASFGPSYLTTKTFDTEYYTDDYFFEQQKQDHFVYDEQDIERLRRDPTVQKVYTNGGFSSWYIPNSSIGT